MDERQTKLEEILVELSKSQDTLKDKKTKSEYFKKLEEIYYIPGADNYRHLYSGIYSTLSDISIDEELSLDILAQNINVIEQKYKPMNRDKKSGSEINISGEINKLYDHVNLDIARINFSKGLSERVKQETKNIADEVKVTSENINDVQKENSNIKGSLDETNEELKRLIQETKKQQKEMQQEYVAILGIFASIVLAFVGDITFSTSVLENIDTISVHRLIFITSFIGAISFDIIWLLTVFIYKIAVSRNNNVSELLLNVFKAVNIGCFVIIACTTINYFCG